jgi:hypothetical protein
MLRILLLFTLLSVIAVGFACGGGENTNSTAPIVGGGGPSPTEAYKMLFAAVKAKDIDGIKKMLTQKTIEFGAMAAQRNNTPIEKMYENGFTATTFSEKLPEMRDERIKENMGALEVWNAKDRKWEDLPFINEDGGWKLAVGDLFADTYKSPGRGLDALEKEAANKVANAAMTPGNTKAYNAPIEVKKGPPLTSNMATNINGRP